MDVPEGIEMLSSDVEVVIAPSASITVSSDDDTDFFAPENEVEELLARAVITLRKGHPKAALAALVDAVNTLADEHHLTGGAFL